METFKVRDTRRKGFFTVDNEAVDIMARIIGPHAFAIYMVLCRHSDKNEESFPSQETIAEKTGMNQRTVLEKTKLLEQHNMVLIQKTRDEKTGEFLHNTYTLLDKSIWTPTACGIHVQSNSIRVEAEPRCSETHTIYTNNIKNTNNKENFSSNDEILKARHIRKSKKQPFSFIGPVGPSGNISPNNKPIYPLIKKGTHAEDVV